VRITSFLSTIFLSTSLIIFVPFNANAVKMDDRVRSFTDAHTLTGIEQRLPVLIVYKPNPRVQFGWHLLAHRDLEIEMIRYQQMQEQTLINSFFNGKELPKISLWIANGTLTTLTRSELRNLRNSPNISSITYGLRESRILPSRPSKFVFSADVFTYGLIKINIPTLRQNFKDLDGRGVRVGIIDTGINPEHKEFRGRPLVFKDFVTPANLKPRDDHGHGSHVAGTIAGGALSGTAIGVAPGVSLIIAKGFDKNGNSKDPNLLQALQWMADPDQNPATNDYAKIISNSWNADYAIGGMNPQDDPFCIAVDNLTKLGIAPVFAAGNDGGSQTIRAPGACPGAITVGATDEDDQVASFSSRGPAKWKNVLFEKPEVAAPGVDILSVDKGGDYRHMSGTSMATPHVAGALALLSQANPNLNAENLKRILMLGANRLGFPQPNSEIGAGRIDVMRSVTILKTSH
jgi:subtilisin family serine protease